MNKLNVVYNQNYDIPLPSGHRFVGTKFSDLYNFIKDSYLFKDLIIHQSVSAPITKHFFAIPELINAFA